MSAIQTTCSSCGAALGAADGACANCGAAATGAAARQRPVLRTIAGARAAAGEGPCQVSDQGAVLITARDLAVLDELARLRLPADDPAARGLIEKLERCRVVPADAIPANVVTLGSRVVFSVDGGAAEARVLVHPDEHTASGWSLPVTTPRGLAMLGLRAGATVMAERRDGGVERIDIISVAFQPEGAGRRRAGRATEMGVVTPLSLTPRRSSRMRKPGWPPRDDEPPPPSAA